MYKNKQVLEAQLPSLEQAILDVDKMVGKQYKRYLQVAREYDQLLGKPDLVEKLHQCRFISLAWGDLILLFSDIWVSLNEYKRVCSDSSIFNISNAVLLLNPQNF
jgi:hypothetical protein